MARTHWRLRQSFSFETAYIYCSSMVTSPRSSRLILSALIFISYLDDWQICSKRGMRPKGYMYTSQMWYIKVHKNCQSGPFFVHAPKNGSRRAPEVRSISLLFVCFFPPSQWTCKTDFFAVHNHLFPRDMHLIPITKKQDKNVPLVFRVQHILPPIFHPSHAQPAVAYCDTCSCLFAF